MWLVSKGIMQVFKNPSHFLIVIFFWGFKVSSSLCVYFCYQHYSAHGVFTYFPLFFPGSGISWYLSSTSTIQVKLPKHLSLCTKWCPLMLPKSWYYYLPVNFLIATHLPRSRNSPARPRRRMAISRPRTVMPSQKQATTRALGKWLLSFFSSLSKLCSPALL